VTRLTRNVTDAHLKEIFSTFGAVTRATVVLDQAVKIPRGFGYVEFERPADAEKARLHLHGGQIDGNTIEVALLTVP